LVNTQLLGHLCFCIGANPYHHFSGTYRSAKNSEMYAQAFLGATTFKLLACLVFVLIFIKETKPEKIVFVVDFMYLYFLNMVFEIYGLLRNLRNQNSR
jgi:F0F1-type ATP synthase assembly protein I